MVGIDYKSAMPLYANFCGIKLISDPLLTTQPYAYLANFETKFPNELEKVLSTSAVQNLQTFLGHKYMTENSTAIKNCDENEKMREIKLSLKQLIDSFYLFAIGSLLAFIAFGIEKLAKRFKLKAC